MTVPTVAVPATTQPPQRLLAVASLSVKPPHWAAAAAAASVAVVVMSCVGLALTVPTSGAADRGQIQAAAETPRQTMQQEAALPDAAVKAAEQQLAAGAAARREEETRLAKSEEDKARAEAARQLAAAEARITAQQAAQRQAAESRPTPEAVEAGLNLSDRDHKRVQVALTALGHQIPATGFFGPITRAMIADWQKTQGLPSSGFLDPSQLATLCAKTVPAEAEAGLNLSERDHKTRAARPDGTWPSDAGDGLLRPDHAGDDCRLAEDPRRDAFGLPRCVAARRILRADRVSLADIRSAQVAGASGRPVTGDAAFCHPEEAIEHAVTYVDFAGVDWFDIGKPARLRWSLPNKSVYHVAFARAPRRRLRRRRYLPAISAGTGLTARSMIWRRIAPASGRALKL